ncbi:hypothetical protein KXW36_009986, partial [Aspergillus fumigatus]
LLLESNILTDFNPELAARETEASMSKSQFEMDISSNCTPTQARTALKIDPLESSMRNFDSRYAVPEQTTFVFCAPETDR